MTQAEQKLFAQQLQDLEKKVMNQIDGLDIYLACDDGSGEIYNRKTGQRYSITLTGKKTNKKDPLLTIGSFETAKAVNKFQKPKIGKWNK